MRTLAAALLGLVVGMAAGVWLSPSLARHCPGVLSRFCEERRAPPVGPAVAYERARERRLANLVRRLKKLSVREVAVVREAEQILHGLFDERV